MTLSMLHCHLNCMLPLTHYPPCCPSKETASACIVKGLTTVKAVLSVHIKRGALISGQQAFKAVQEGGGMNSVCNMEVMLTLFVVRCVICDGPV